jgi:RNA polymerase nonessential primary-like sigma factor
MFNFINSECDASLKLEAQEPEQLESEVIEENIIELTEVHENNYLDKSPDPTDLYLKEVGIASLLTKEEEVYYARLVQKGDVAAKNKMIESNLRLVIKIARRYLRSGMAILDLIEEGNLGLIRAVEKFDPERGFRFSTYGAWWIQQTIERAIMSQNRTIRLPVHMVKKLNSCLRTGRELSKTLDHEPTSLDIAKEMDKSFADVDKIMYLNEKIISIDSPISEEVNKPIADTIGNNCNDPAIDISDENLKKNIHLWLSELTINQRKVVERRFGLNQFEPKTLEQTGEDIGLTRERVRQLQEEALKQLKEIITRYGNDFHTLVS